MAVSDQQQIAAMTTTPSEVDQLKTQVTLLTEQVAALTTRQKNEEPRHCFYCNRLGHTQRSSPTQFTSQSCYIYNQLGHFARDCWQGNAKGDVYQGQQASPIPVSPNNTIVVATIKSHVANIFGKVGGINTEIMLDSGSSVSLLSP